jgi:hypothetical protein
MRSILIFAGVYIVSLVAAYAAGSGLAAYFFLDEEFYVVTVALALFSLLAIAVFAVIYAAQPNVTWLGYGAIGLAAVAFGIEQVPALADAFAGRSTDPYLVGAAQDRALATTLLLPALVMLLVQWPLIRRRWLVARGREHRMRWPWFTIALAGMLALSRPGLEVIGSVVRRSSTDWLVGLWTVVLAIACGVLLGLALIEYWLRRRWLTRRAVTH